MTFIRSILIKNQFVSVRRIIAMMCRKHFFFSVETFTGLRLGSREYIRQIERERERQAGKNACHRTKPSFAGEYFSFTCDFARAKNSREKRVYTPWAPGSMVIRQNIGNNTRKYIPFALQVTSVHNLGNETERVRASLPL